MWWWITHIITLNRKRISTKWNKNISKRTTINLLTDRLSLRMMIFEKGTSGDGSLQRRQSCKKRCQFWFTDINIIVITIWVNFINSFTHICACYQNQFAMVRLSSQLMWTYLKNRFVSRELSFSFWLLFLCAYNLWPLTNELSVIEQKKDGPMLIATMILTKFNNRTLINDFHIETRRDIVITLE